MCHKFVCVKCFKPTWVGCGKHIDYALDGVPEDNRCHCKPYTQALHDAQNGGASCTVQ
ncbi:hypothetical protein C2E20_1094 [Micractinium conductrix]|uniref:Uncharacterized protein n=1 Tax=Micractinium conductrix TaxID=554055 RepID=A0A2P6VNP1_9CHLO|nr:hypothetical protein C2E20_1094 [Micractinium conductrix]|eukprot:PSC75677.1 hypothetical protein C2E20_1094 [Micractinium conductrix]